MVDPYPRIKEALDQRKNTVLLYAQAAMPESQFIAFRKLFLNEMGISGFLGELQNALTHSGKERKGQAR